MKKRIISLILVVVLSVLALAGCAYNYQDADLTKYATFNAEDFLKALKTLKIEDADFGVDAEKREDQVDDAIIKTLASLVTDGEKLTKGKPGGNDTVRYCYFVTYKNGDDIMYFFADKLKESTPTSLQLGLSSATDFEKKVAAAILDGADIDARTYKTETTGKTEAGDIVVVSYKRSYTTTETKDGKTVDKTVDETVTNQILTLPKTDNDKSFLDKLIGESVNTALFGDKGLTVKETVDGAEKSVTYTGVKVNWVVEDGIKENADGTYTGEFASFTHKYEGTDKPRNIYGKNDVDLKDKEVTYHILPVDYVDVMELADLKAEVIVKDILKDSIKVAEDANENGKIDENEKATLPVFDDAGYKNGSDTIIAIVKALAELQEDLVSAESKVEDAKKTLEDAEKKVKDAEDKGKDPLPADTAAVTTAKNALTAAEGELKTAEKDVDDKIKALLGCKKADGEAIDKVIEKEYRQLRYDGLESKYKNDIKQRLAKEVFALANKYIEYKKDDNGRSILPTSAVNEAYDRILNNYKYNFYEGKYTSDNSSSGNTSSSKTNYKAYNGDFNRYLKETLVTVNDPMQKVYDAIGAKAEQSVKDIILVYVLADVCNNNLSGSVDVTNEDITEFKSSINYMLIQYQTGNQDIDDSEFLPAIQLDNVLNFILEEKAEKDYAKDDKYGENKVQYYRVEYDFKDAK